VRYSTLLPNIRPQKTRQFHISKGKSPSLTGWR